MLSSNNEALISNLQQQYYNNNVREQHRQHTVHTHTHTDNSKRVACYADHLRTHGPPSPETQTEIQPRLKSGSERVLCIIQ